jgi:hypothetical protein
MRAAFTLISPESPAILLKRLEDSIALKRNPHRDLQIDDASRLIEKRSRWLSESPNSSQSRPYYRGFVTNDGFEVIRIPSWFENTARVIAIGQIELNSKGESIIRVSCRYPLQVKVVIGFFYCALFAFGLNANMTTSDTYASCFFVGVGLFMAFIFFFGRLAEEKDLEWNLRKILHAKSLS